MFPVHKQEKVPVRRIIPPSGRHHRSLDSAWHGQERPMADYSDTPLYKKLGVKPDTRLLLLDAPDNFLSEIQPLPLGAEITIDSTQPIDIVLLFVQQEEELQARFAALAALLPPSGGLWIAWPKKTSRLPTDLTFDIVQQIGRREVFLG